jgi:hypothetical protein
MSKEDVMVQTAPQVERSAWAGLAARMVITLIGAGAMIIGAFLDWTGGTAGTDLDVRAFWATDPGTTDTFLSTVGFVMIVLGLLALVGLAARTGWLTRVAGALGMAAVVLFAIQLFRTSGNDDIQAVQAGAWIALAGSLVALIGGFLGTRTVTSTYAPASTVAPVGSTTTTTTQAPVTNVVEPPA